MDKSFSLIIPVYNSFKYMGKCLECLNNQTYKNFEVIFIDDCSKDDSYESLSTTLKSVNFEYKLEKNERNSGPGYSRNHGIKIATKDYLMFLDSDDFLTNDCLFKVNEILKKDDYDCLVFDYYMYYEDGTTKSRASIRGNIETCNKEQLLALATGSTWCKVYNAKVIKSNEVTFPNLMRSEDLAFNKVAASLCDKIYYLKENMYYYVQRNDSIMHDYNTLNEQNNIDAFNYIKDRVSYSKGLEMIFIREYLYLITQICILKKYKTKKIKKFINESVKLYPDWYKNEFISFQPLYIKICLKFIKWRFILPLRLIFKLKK